MNPRLWIDVARARKTAVRLRTVEAAEYDPYGVPTILGKDGSGAVKLLAHDVESVSRFGVVTGANVLDTELLAPTTSGGPGYAAQSAIGWRFRFTARPWDPASRTYDLRHRR